MGVEEELNQIDLMMRQGRYKNALQKVDVLEKVPSLTNDDRLTCLHLKSEILTILGDYDQAISLAHYALQESEKIDKPLRVVDSVIKKVLPLSETKKFDECFSLIEKGEQVLNAVSDIELSKINKRKADLCDFRGRVQLSKGELDNALESVLKSLSLREEVDIKVDTAFTHQLVGTVYTAKGELDQALEHFKESETIGEEYNHVFLSALSSYSIGGNYLSKGELDQALTYYQKTLAIKETLPFGLTQNTLNNLGIIFINKGELDQGLEYYKRSLAINEASGNQRSIAINLGNIGEAYIAKDDLKSAAECFNRALDIYRNLNNDWGVAEVLYNLVQYFVDDLSSDTTSSYLDEFKEINTRRKDVPIISQKFRLTKAIVLKSSERLTDKMTALSIFQEIADEEVVWYELTVAAMLNLGKLLILELKTTGNEKVLTDVKKIADQLQDIAEKQNSYWLLVETYLLQSKLALMELNVEQALQLLNQTEQLANEKKLSQLIKTISIERDLLTTQLTKWEEIIDKKPSVSERIQLTQLNTLLERMLHREQYHNEKEIMKYAEEARQLVEAWEK